VGSRSTERCRESAPRMEGSGARAFANQALTRDTVQTAHPSPSAREFRLLLKGLATSELRRMFCSYEGGCGRDLVGRWVSQGNRGPRGLVQVSGRVNGGTSTPGARTVAPILVSESGDTVETKRAAHRFAAIRTRSLNDPHPGSSIVRTVTDASVTIRPPISTSCSRG
jgi:hypothetical protein